MIKQPQIMGLLVKTTDFISTCKPLTREIMTLSIMITAAEDSGLDHSH
jgi:hypothetical protein